MAACVIETPAFDFPVALRDMKTWLRVDFDDDDYLIEGLIQAATEVTEAFCARSWMMKTYRQSLDSFPYFVDTIMSQMAYPPSYYALPRYSTTLWNYSQMTKLFWSPLDRILSIDYVSSQTGQIESLLPALFSWQPNTIYRIGDQIEDSAGNIQEVTSIAIEGEDELGDIPGESFSGPTEPTFGADFGDTSTDDGSDLRWTNKGEAPAGDFIYDADSEPPRIFPLAGQFWPSVLYVPNSVLIRYVAGYASVNFDDDVALSAVPQAAITAIMMLVANWYENRESTSPLALKQIPDGVERLLWSCRVLDFAPTRG